MVLLIAHNGLLAHSIWTASSFLQMCLSSLCVVYSPESLVCRSLSSSQNPSPFKPQTVCVCDCVFLVCSTHSGTYIHIYDRIRHCSICKRLNERKVNLAREMKSSGQRASERAQNYEQTFGERESERGRTQSDMLALVFDTETVM